MLNMFFCLNHFQSLTRNTAIEVASTVKALYNETESLLLGRVSLVSYCGREIVMLMAAFSLTLRFI